MKIIWALINLLVVFNLGCQEQKPSTVIAKVGDAELTLEEAKSSLASSQVYNKKELQKYVMNWINEELLYQEARRKGIDNTQQFKARMSELQKHVTVQQFIDHQIFLDSTEIDESAALNYFEQNRAEFFIREDLIKLNIITFNNRDRAAWFASQVSRGAIWQEVLADIKNDSIAASSLTGYTTGKFYSQRTLSPQELWKVAFTLGINDISFPVKTAFGYSILQFLSRKKKGDVPEYEIVQDEVKQRIIIENRRQQHMKLLNDLRNRYKVEIFLSQISLSDTFQTTQHE